MTDHTTIPKVSRLEVIATGSRRRWTADEKQRIVAESLSAPRNVSATARRHGLSAGQLFTWRRLAREGKLMSASEMTPFVPAVVACGDSPAGGGRMEIVISGGRRVIVGSDVDPAALRRVLDVLDRR